MQILVSDTSCLIDLRKASLLGAFVQLNYDLVIPDVLFEEELVQFSQAEKELIEKTFKIAKTDTPPPTDEEVKALLNEDRHHILHPPTKPPQRLI